MIKEYGIYRTTNIYAGNKHKGLIEIEIEFSTHERAETRLLEASKNKEIAFSYKGEEYIIIPYYRNNE